MEKFMVLVAVEGKLQAHFFMYADCAKRFNAFMSVQYSSKLYVYIPDTDSWEAAADQF